MSKVPVNNLKNGFELYKEELENKALEVLRSGWYILGNEVKQFEKEFSEVIGTKYCVGVDNGLNAISLGIRALGITIGDEVLVQANTYIATVLGITINGATPVFVEPTEYYNMDPNKIEELITRSTKAVLVTHLYGQATEMKKIIEICEKYNLFLLEDCAQSHYAKYDNQMTGTFGVMGFFSFYPTKNLGAFGDAGAVVTNDKELAYKIQMLRNYGSVIRYENMVEGYNSRLDELQAGLLRVKLKHLTDSTKEREYIASRYLNEMTNPLVKLPRVAHLATHVWHLFVVEVTERDRFREYLASQGVDTDIHYKTPPHLSVAYKRLGHSRGDLPITETIVDKIVSLPIYNGMTDEEIETVIAAVNSYEK